MGRQLSRIKKFKNLPYFSCSVVTTHVHISTPWQMKARPQYLKKHVFFITGSAVLGYNWQVQMLLKAIILQDQGPAAPKGHLYESLHCHSSSLLCIRVRNHDDAATAQWVGEELCAAGTVQ